MADLPENIEWTAGIYQLETSDPVLGGPDGIDNLQAKQLANRSRWLKDQLDKIVSGATSIGKAIKLATARTISVSGAATGSTSFDGSANANIALTLADSGAVAGSYPKVTINNKGLVVAGSAMVAADIPALDWSKITTGKPSTLAGYGITDAVAFGQYGVGAPLGLVGGSELNTLLQDGVYVYSSGSSLGHSPIEGASHVIVRGSAAYPHQEFKRIYQNRYFFRAANKVNPTVAEADWEPWVEMLHTGNMVQATQAEAEAGASSAVWMSALRVAQAIAKAVTQATETAFGWLKISTQLQVTTGTDDATAVTPKKLRAAQATQAEAEAGALDTKLMTPLRVFQAIAKVVTQATETAFGWLKISTQLQVTTGTDDATAVTPKKLRAAQATQAEAEAGALDTKLMTPLRVFQA
ncbi:hypothetical protein APB07_22300, partial [Pseudomonas aeruginosa]